MLGVLILIGLGLAYVWYEHQEAIAATPAAPDDPNVAPHSHKHGHGHVHSDD
jgi:hypothetical protein